MRKFMENAKPTIVLGSICLVVALLLALVNMITAPIIKRAEDAAVAESLVQVMPNGTGFASIGDISSLGLPSEVMEAYTEQSGGYVFRLLVTGKSSSGMVILCGVDAEGKITGTKIISESESDGYKEPVYAVVEDGQYYKDMTAANLEYYHVGGSTKTAKAYYDAVKAALDARLIILGEEVDDRTPEQKLQDNCNAALGTEGKTFTAFMTSWDAFGDCTVYTTTDGGVVVKLGDAFVGYSEAGAAIGEFDTDTLLQTDAAYAAYASCEAVDLSAFSGIGSAVKGMYKTQDGLYLVSLENTGFKYAETKIKIELVVDSDAVIVSCVTVSHSESAGYGAVCGSPEYYEQFNGKDVEGVDGVGAIAGATQTQNGYRNAVKQGIRAVETVEGGSI